MNSLKQNQLTQAERISITARAKYSHAEKRKQITYQFNCTKLGTSSINSSMSDVCALRCCKNQNAGGIYFCVYLNQQSRLNSMKYLRSVSQQWLGELTSRCKKVRQKIVINLERMIFWPPNEILCHFSLRIFLCVRCLHSHRRGGQHSLDGCGTGPLKFHHFDAHKRTIQHQTYTCVGAGGVPHFF